MAKLRVGIVGLGMGQNLLPANKSPNYPVMIQGVCDLVAEKTAAAKRDFGVEFATDSFEAILERDDIDIVAIYTPDHMHRDQVVQALEAGKHVLVTKPMTVSTAESEAVIAAVKRTGKRVMPAQSQRFTLPHMAARRYIDDGEFGHIYFVAADYYQDLRPVYDYTPWRYKVPQDFIYGGLSHNIDIMRFLKGEITEVSAYGSYSGLDLRYPKNTFETFAINVRFADGSIGRMAMAPGVRPPLPNIYVQVFGTKATFVRDQLVLDSLEGKPILNFEFADARLPSTEMRVLLNFADAILADKPQAVDEVDGARITAVGDAITASIKAGGAPTKVRLDF